MNTEQIDQVVARMPRAGYPTIRPGLVLGDVGITRRTWDRATATQCRYLVEQGMIITEEDAPRTEYCSKCLEGTDMPDCPLSLKEQVMCARRRGYGRVPSEAEICHYLLGFPGLINRSILAASLCRRFQEGKWI